MSTTHQHNLIASVVGVEDLEEQGRNHEAGSDAVYLYANITLLDDNENSLTQSYTQNDQFSSHDHSDGQQVGDGRVLVLQIISMI